MNLNVCTSVDIFKLMLQPSLMLCLLALTRTGAHYLSLSPAVTYYCLSARNRPACQLQVEWKLANDLSQDQGVAVAGECTRIDLL